jgi:hypothetical protein
MAGASGHGEAARRFQVLIDSSEVTCHDEIVSVRAKNVAPERWPAARRRLCPGRRNCRGAVKLIKDANLSLIDFKSQL